MKSIQKTLVSALALGVLGMSAAHAQVNSSLVAADSAAQPGKPLTVALKMEHEHGWHTYWVNPGIGEATSIEWQLPAGWAAGDIEWPVPHAIKGEDGAVTGHGYEGTSYLPVTINVPKTAKVGETVTLKGLASLKPRQIVEAQITRKDGSKLAVPLVCRIDTLDEIEYYKNGGILQYVLRNLAA